MAKGGTVDEIVGLEVPTALFRGRRDHAPGKIGPRHTYYSANGNLFGGSHAGAILLEPSINESRQMQKTLRNPTQRCHVASHTLEQDFLTRWYDKRSRGLNKKFNDQLYQLLLAKDVEELA